MFILKRILLIFPTFIGVTLLTFILIHLIPGDPVEILAGERGMSPERHAHILKELGLDRPLPIQYLDYLVGIFKGDLGESYVTHQPVLQEFMARFPATIELAIGAMVFALTLGLPAGILAALNRGKTLDHTVMTVALTGYSMPIFWWGLMLILLFSNTLGWTPVSGRMSSLYWVDEVTGFMLIDSFISEEEGAFKAALHHLVLPCIVLGTIPLAVIARMTRSAMLEILREDYIQSAYARGLSPLRVIFVHALRNALIPVITVIGLQVGLLLAGAVLTETVFSWPGIGTWIVESLYRRDYPVIQGGILLISLIIIHVNLIVDLLYGIANPRIRQK